jgi:hypothetical protein
MLVSLFATLSACVYFQVGDNTLPVKGELEIPPGKSATCELQLWSEKDERLLRSLPISEVFRTTFTVYWKPMRYFVIVSCEEWGEIYRSPGFLGGEPSRRDKPFDLGRIPLPNQ